MIPKNPSNSFSNSNMSSYRGVKLVQKTLSNDLPSWDSGNGCRVAWLITLVFEKILRIPWWGSVFLLAPLFRPFTSGGVCGSKIFYSQGIWKTKVGSAVKVGWKKDISPRKNRSSCMDYWGEKWNTREKYSRHMEHLGIHWGWIQYINGFGRDEEWFGWNMF